MTDSTIALPHVPSGKGPSRTPGLTVEMNDLMQICIEAAQRIAELNGRAINTTIDEQRAIALQATNERSPFGAWRLHTSFALEGTATDAGSVILTGDLQAAPGANENDVHIITTKPRRSD